MKYADLKTPGAGISRIEAMPAGPHRTYMAQAFAQSKLRHHPRKLVVAGHVSGQRRGWTEDTVTSAAFTHCRSAGESGRRVEVAEVGRLRFGAITQDGTIKREKYFPCL